MKNEKSKMSMSDIFGIIGGAFSIVSSIFMAYQEYKFHKEEMARRNDDIKLLAKELADDYISASLSNALKTARNSVYGVPTGTNVPNKK